MTLLSKLFPRLPKKKKPIYGWSIFALDDRINLTRQVTEAQRVQQMLLP